MVRVEEYSKLIESGPRNGASETALREVSESKLSTASRAEQGPGEGRGDQPEAGVMLDPDIPTHGAESIHAPSPAEIEAESKRLLKSKTFARSPRLRHLLAHIITQWLNGNMNRLDGYNIAIDVFQRGMFFDSGLDPIVRVEMARLRRQLARCYEIEAQGSVVRIEIPKGRYVPLFTRQANVLGEPSVQGADALSVLVLPFTVQEDQRLIPFYDQFLCQLTQEPGLRVISRSLAVHFAGGRGDPLAPHPAIPHFFIEGCASCDGEQYHIIMHLSDNIRGYTAWSGRYAATAGSIAEAIRIAARDLAEAMHAATNPLLNSAKHRRYSSSDEAAMSAPTNVTVT